MRRILSFLNETAGTELVLPVTPPSYQWSFGRQIESVMLDQLAAQSAYPCGVER